MRVAEVKDHYSAEEFNKLFKYYKHDAIVYNRLVFIRSIRNGNTIKDTVKILDINRRTGYEWLKRYNENGVEGLIPHFNERGRKCLLSDEQLKELEAEVDKRNIRSIKNAQKYISLNFHINYSYKQVWEIMRVKLGFNYGKPFLKYRERPKDYKEKLKKKLKIFIEAFIKNQIFLAFMDQSHFQNMPNIFRMLYKAGIKNILYRTGQKFGISATGIMGVNCDSYIEFYERNNSFTTILTLIMFRILNMEDEKGKELLKNIITDPTIDREYIEKELSKNIKTKSEKLKEIEIEQSKNRKNKETTFNKIKQICNDTPKITSQKISITQRTTIKDLLIDSEVEDILINEKEILLILDNAKIHHANDVKIASKILNIELMYLPEYSPDLNPIEDLWKIIKSKVYLADYNNLDELMWIVTEEFYEHVTSSSLYEGWIDEFMRY